MEKKETIKQKKNKKETLSTNPEYYVVNGCDNLEKIASEFNSTEQELKDLNDIEVVYQGQTIRVK